MSKNSDTFFDRSSQALTDPTLAKKIGSATNRRYIDQNKICKTEFPDLQEIRQLVESIRINVLQNLDHYLSQLVDRLSAVGVQVHFAQDSAHAQKIILDIAQKNNVQNIVKSKSMVSEEIELNHFLKEHGLKVLETDLGEFIIQQAEQKPSHLICPAVHLSKEDIADLFQKKLDYDGPSDPTLMTKFARKVLREEFRQADMGISGVNFAVADPGLISICTNEGNGRYITTRPKVYVALMGMERIVPDLESAAVMMKVLTRHATGQRITQYNSFIHGPSENDGPQQVHLVILDNGRSEILSKRYWPVLRCIRCGACLNACPVFRNLGGHAYGGAYSGPIGMMVLPLLFGLDSYPDLAKGCSLCDICGQVCPTKIPIGQILTELRNDLVQKGKTPLLEKLSMRIWAWGLRHHHLYKFAQRLMPWALKPFSQNGWVKNLPSMPGRWTHVKDLPLPAKKSFIRTLKETGFANSEGKNDAC
jgi:L-lactate dehydrogenase complex protein LldF